MALWPLQDSGSADQGGALVASSTAAIVTASATIHTKGAWVELIASTSLPVSELVLYSTGALFVAGSDTSSLFDIGIGAAGVEVVVVSDVLMGGVSPSMWSWRLPVGIAQGSRVAIRMQSAVASKTIEAQMYAIGGGFVPPDSGGSAVTWGAVPAASSGTLLATPGAVNTKAAWTVLSAATTASARYALVTAQPVTGITVTLATHLIDIGIGAAGVEQVIIPNISAEVDANERIQYAPLCFPVSIPAGTRLVARQQSNSIVTTGVPRVAVTLFS